MSAFKEVYDVIKDVRNLAKEYKNGEMVDKIIDIQEAFFDIREEMENLKEENKSLKSTIEEMKNTSILEDDLELTTKGYYIRKSDAESGKRIYYCPACWQNYKKLIPLFDLGTSFSCPNCKAVEIGRAHV